MVPLLIEIYDKCGEKNISKLISEFNNEIDVFIQQHQLNLIIDGFLNYSTFIDVDLLVEEPSGLLQIALLTNAIYIKLNENDLSDQMNILKMGLKDSLSNQISLIIKKSNSQLAALNNFLLKISAICLEKQNKKICILELPVGNSIPSIILKEIFKAGGKETEIITVSLNRNDRKITGITRKEIIIEKLNNLNFEDTILIYVDEWISGANFYNIIDILSKIPDLCFLPCAFMTDESSKFDSFSKYRKKHRDICEVFGYTPEELLCEIPKLNSKINSFQKFIWAESDRLSGYRKFEFFGSILSTFLAVGNLLMEDLNKLDYLLNQTIDENTDLSGFIEIPHELKNEIINSFIYFNSTFSEALEDRLKSIKIDIIEEIDIKAETDKVISIFTETNGYKESKLAINIICYYMNKNLINPESRYYYKGQAPICIELKEHERLINLEFIRQFRLNFFKQ